MPSRIGRFRALCIALPEALIAPKRLARQVDNEG